ncbi:hypothetical protein O9993_20120 [Vibrio lentus]|nr:hypothetical protein [Vibrio lentus]
MLRNITVFNVVMALHSFSGSTMNESLSRDYLFLAFKLMDLYDIEQVYVLST